MFWQLLDAACAAHLRAGAQTQLCVNIAAPQIGDQWFAQKLIQALAQAGFPPSRLEIEVTESDLIVDSESARTLLLSLKNQGVKIALDDFGTGYSSLLMLRDLPIDKLKIDRSFVSALGENGAADVKIVEAIIRMAAALDLTITAEGIESEAAAKLLGDLHCDYGQGFLFGAARPGFELPSDSASDAGVLIRRAR
jgi:EAL domain-containing protein (putative c-di-GMP-specific phosphodiesterase class I)